MFKKQVGKIVGCKGVVTLDRKSLLVSSLRLLPITLGFVERAERDNDLCVGRSEWNRALVAGNRRVWFPACRLHGSKRDQRSGVRGSKFNGFGQGLLGVGLLRIASLRLAEKKCQTCIVGGFLELFLKSLDGGGWLTALEIQISKRVLRLERAGVASKRLVKQRVCIGPTLLLDAQETKLDVAGGILRRGQDKTIQVGFGTRGIALICASRRMNDVTIGGVRSD